MAVSEMKKLSCAVLKSDADRLMRALQKLSLVELTRTDTESAELSSSDVSEESAALAAELAAVRRAIEFLMPYDTRKYSMFSPPQEGNADDFEGGLDVIVSASVKAANEQSSKIASLSSRASELASLIEALSPWAGWDIALPEDRTVHTVTLCGTLPSNAQLDVIEGKLDGCEALLQVISDGGTKGQTAVAVTSHASFEEAVRKVLASSGFTKCAVAASESEGCAAGKRDRLKKELSSARSELANAEKAAMKLSDKLPDIKAYHDVLLSRVKRTEAKGGGANTEKTVIFTGWVPKKAEEKVAKVLTSYDAAYSFDDPCEGDDVPVSLNNNAFAKNFEPVLSMYSLPAYGTFDPTMIMSVFYAVIFGLMFADVGYGVILLAGCLLGLKLMHPKEGMKRMMTMFAFCAVACIVGGVLFGGYFGDLPNAIRQNFGGVENVESPALLFDMIEQPMSFLVVSLAIGAVHLIAGMLIKFYILVKDGHVLDAIFDVGSWLILFAGIGVYFVSSTAGLVTAGVGALMLVCTQGRHEKNIIMKFAKGLLSLYDLVSYASDLLSYSRILALGLASAVIASVVNLLGTMGGPTVAGIILFVFVFLIGHVINFLVNILGTYVHTSRLQYIEFFGKFFEPGGREFAPLKYESKYVNLK